MPDFSIPAAIDGQVDAPVEVWANGIPTHVSIARSKWKVDDLFRHYYRLFEDAQFFIPPEKNQATFQRQLQLTAVDVYSDKTYTVFLAPMPDGNTSVIFGQADFRRMKPPAPAEDPVPLPLNAKNVVRSNSEGAWSLAFESDASARAVMDYFDTTMAERHYKRVAPGIYDKGEEEVRILTTLLQHSLHVLVSNARADTSGLGSPAAQ